MVVGCLVVGSLFFRGACVVLLDFGVSVRRFVSNLEGRN